MSNAHCCFHLRATGLWLGYAYMARLRMPVRGAMVSASGLVHELCVVPHVCVCVCVSAVSSDTLNNYMHHGMSQFS